MKNILEYSKDIYDCPYCDKKYTKKGIGSHIWRSHTEEGKIFNPGYGDPGDARGWSKGKTKESDIRLRNLSTVLKDGYERGRLKPSFKGKKHTKDTINKISNSLKQAHKEGRAWNIGKSRWNNKPSYPEKFFMKIIENEFEDKNYLREYPVGIYSIDFAWVYKKKAIEIDGDQHDRFIEYKERDERKNKKLEEEGWDVLRIKWCDFYNNTKYYIQEAIKFIEG